MFLINKKTTSSKPKWLFIPLIALIAIGCQSDDPKPGDETEKNGMVSIQNISIELTGLRSFKASGTISIDGSLDLVDKGVCWGTAENPTIQDSKKSAGADLGLFSTEITGLNLNTDYFMRVYAQSEDSVIYSSQLSFSTKITSSLTIDSVNSQAVTLNGIISEELDPITLFSGICWDTIPNPTIQSKKNKPLNSGDFTTVVNNLTPNTRYYFRTFLILESDTLFSSNTQSVTPPLLGSTSALASADSYTIASGFYDSEINGPEEILEKGFVISKNSMPTISSGTKVISTTLSETMYKGIKGLEENTTYYIRAFASNEELTGYSEQDTLATTASKGIRFTLNMSDEPTADQLDAYVILTKNMNTAVDYYHQYTNCNKYVWVNYVPGVPTADANYEGWMRFGSNRPYMNVRTCLHELAHTVGIGTSSGFNNLMVDNIWTGAEGIKTVRELTGNSSANINRYGVHIGPFGLNYDSEGTSHQDFVNHCKLIESMRKDGL